MDEYSFALFECLKGVGRTESRLIELRSLERYGVEVQMTLRLYEHACALKLAFG